MRLTIKELRALIAEALENVAPELTANFRSENGWYEISYQDMTADDEDRHQTHFAEVEAFSAQAAIHRFAKENPDAYVTGVAPTEDPPETVVEGIDDDSDDFNNAVDELMKEPHMRSIEAFAEHKFDEGEETFSTLELQALARNLYLNDAGRSIAKSTLATAPAAYRDRVKEELSGYGLRFQPRDKVRQVRGFTSPFHGSNRFAGTHGGSGFEGIRGGHSANRTPSAGRTFDPSDDTALGMGSKKKR